MTTHLSELERRLDVLDHKLHEVFREHNITPDAVKAITGIIGDMFEAFGLELLDRSAKFSEPTALRDWMRAQGMGD